VSIFLLCCAIVYVASIIIFAITTYRQAFCWKNQTLDYTKDHGLTNGDFDQAYLDQPWHEFEVPSPHGYKIACVALEAHGAGSASEQSSDPWQNSVPVAIFVHGIGWTRYGMFKYMKHFSAQGWTVVALDLPGHGKSKAPRRYYPTFGHNEKHDVAAVVDYVRSKWPNAPKIGLLGESMGAGTVLEYAPLSKGKIDFVIADCPFESFVGEVDYLMREKRWIPDIVQVPALWLFELIARITKGFWIASISPKNDIVACSVPVLFVHGLEDTWVPYIWSLRMYDWRKTKGKGQTEIFLVPGARHTGSVRVDPEGWRKAVFGFIERTS
jgi:alpha-beta hydrolase superfamily lysophospholipase